MNSDIVERLRQERPQYYESTMREAADEIERCHIQMRAADEAAGLAKAEIERLRKRCEAFDLAIDLGAMEIERLRTALQDKQ